MRHADHRGTHGLELIRRLGEFMRLDRATRRERGRIEIEDHRTLLQGIGQRERERLARQRGLGREIRRLRTGLQRGEQRRRQHRDAHGNKNETLHDFESLVEKSSGEVCANAPGPARRQLAQ